MDQNEDSVHWIMRAMLWAESSWTRFLFTLAVWGLVLWAFLSYFMP